MAFIGCLEITNAPEKKKFFKNILNEKQYDGCVILGAQYEDDTKYLHEEFSMKGLPIYLVDIRKQAFEDFPEYNKCRQIKCDLTNKEDETSVLLEAKEKCSYPLVYDNLSGHLNRLDNAERILDMFPEHVMYTHKRRGTHIKAFERFDIVGEKNLNQHNCIMNFKKKSNEESIKLEDSNVVSESYKRYGPMEKSLPCPVCNAKPPWTKVRKRKLPKYRCLRCKHEYMAV